jgi:precorrin-2 dehydrogenase / sirohydrochlorin ferrochelatase
VSLYYPIFLNLKAKKCVVIGGGQVALRKAKALLECQAAVEVISPKLCSEFNELAEHGKIRASLREYQQGDLQGAMIAIAATNDRKTNAAVAAEAHLKSIMLNVVDNAELSDYIVPSCINRGELTIAISTSGKSPALARKLRSRIEKELADEYSTLIILVDGVRQELKRRKIRVSSQTWQKALDLDLLIEMVKRGEKEKTRITLLNNLGIKPS